MTVRPGDAPAAEASVVPGRFVDSFFRRHPVTATFAGRHEHDVFLPDWSPEGLAAAAAERREVRRAIDGAGLARLSPQALVRRDWDAIDGALATACLDIEDAEDTSGHFVRGNPSLAVGEALFGLVALAWDVHRPVRDRVAAMAARAAGIPRFLAGAQRTMAGRPIPRAWSERADRECAAGIDLLSDLAVWGAEQGAGNGLAESCHDAAAACQAFRDSRHGDGTTITLTGNDVLAASDAGSAHAVGEGMLRTILRRGHWCDVSPSTLAEEAREGLAVERQKLADLLAARSATWPEVAERLALDHPEPDQVLDACAETWRRVREAASDQVTWPGIPSRYDAMPSWARRAAPRLYYLYYRSPAPFAYPAYDRYAVPVPLPDDSPGAVSAFSRTWNRSAILLNHVAHHGGLGHHVQNWHAARSPSRIGRFAAVDGASRIAMMAGGTMAEGWACYATELCERLGLLSPDECIAEQHTRVRLMVRAVVDLELHAGGMAFGDAERLHQDQAGLSLAAARNEVTKCSMFPGTASMYWLGLRELRRLREREERARGAAFDVRSFHDEVLSCGSIPVCLVTQLVDASRSG